jgi:hypothetical protein
MQGCAEPAFHATVSFAGGCAYALYRAAGERLHRDKKRNKNKYLRNSSLAFMVMRMIGKRVARMLPIQARHWRTRPNPGKLINSAAC